MATLIEGPSGQFIEGSGLAPNQDQTWILSGASFLDVVLVSVGGTVPGDDIRSRDLEVTHIVYESPSTGGTLVLLTVRNVGVAAARYGIRTCLIVQ